MENQNPDFGQNVPSPEPSNQSLKQKVISKKKVIIYCAVVIIAAGAYLFHAKYPNATNSRIITGSPECIDLVKKNEAKVYDGLYHIECKLTPRKIGNSSLTAKFLEYGATPKNDGECFDIGAVYPTPDYAKYCVGFYGTVVSDGKIYQGVGGSEAAVLTEYDYCYSTRLHIYNNFKPTNHDLYFYQGDLYNRDVYNNVEIKTPYGTCVLNGTTLSHPSKPGGNYEYLTNVKVDYKGFPKDCMTITLGRKADDSIDCNVLVTIANASLDECYSNQTPIVKDGKITGYKTEKQPKTSHPNASI